MKDYFAERFNLARYFLYCQSFWLKKLLSVFNQTNRLIVNLQRHPRIPGQCPP
ncbi:hypothetical protein IQ238_05945 [Pleurocapsales cyanobacterium LEGE 06147]|nr:hypothetical protein [Pleurocapsales cyanobacterium LEGE 06147]